MAIDRVKLREEFYQKVDKSDLTLIEAVKTMRKIAGKTQKEYAIMAKIGPKVLIDFERGAGNPTLNSIAKMLRPFGLELTVRRRRAQDRSSLPKKSQKKKTVSQILD